MGLRFRHSFRLFPGVRLNLSGRGVSASIGVPGATVNAGRHGVRATVGLPGSGLSYSARIDGGGRTGRRGGGETLSAAPGYVPAPASAKGTSSGREIRSRGISELSSASLAEVRSLLRTAREQLALAESDLADATAAREKIERVLDKRRRSLFRAFMRGHIARLTARLQEARGAEADLVEWRDRSVIDMSFAASGDVARPYDDMVRAFERARHCACIWDVTTEKGLDRRTERSLADVALSRTPVTIDFGDARGLRCDGRGMRFGNANGEDVLIYPGLAYLGRADGNFALIDLRELTVVMQSVGYIETDPVPADAKVAGTTWLKTNADGSRDRRFRDNRELPVCHYTQIVLRTPSGLEEAYMFSDADAGEALAKALIAYQRALAAL